MEKEAEQKKRIAVVEDEAALAEILRVKLERVGYEVLVSSDGISGLEMIRSQKPDLVLLDIMLPGMDGYGVLSHLKEDNIIPGLPVIVISNSGEPLQINKILEFGVRDYLVKLNFSPYEVLDKVNHILKSSV